MLKLIGHVLFSNGKEGRISVLGFGATEYYTDIHARIYYKSKRYRATLNITWDIRHYMLFRLTLLQTISQCFVYNVLL